MLGLGVPDETAFRVAPVDAAQTAWLVAPDLVPRLPYVIAVAMLADTVLAGFGRRVPVAS